jgi:hypothetical protein
VVVYSRWTAIAVPQATAGSILYKIAKSCFETKLYQRRDCLWSGVGDVTAAEEDVELVVTVHSVDGQ